MTKRYRLLKPLPDCNAGAIYHSTDNGKDYVCYENMSDGLNHNWSVAYDKKYVENNPEWFEEIKPEPITDNKEFTSDFNKVPFGLYEIFWKSGGSSLAAIGGLHSGERWIAPTNWTNKHYPTGKMNKHKDSIEKMILLHSKSSHPSTAPMKEDKERIEVGLSLPTRAGGYVLNTSHKIPIEKYDSIKQAIEQVLNDDDEVFKVLWRDEECFAFRYNGQSYELNLSKKYSQKELDEAIEKTWEEARMLTCDYPITGFMGTGLKFNHLSDYKQSLSSHQNKNQTT